MSSGYPVRSQARHALGKYLREQREAAGLTQKDLAKKLKYSSAQFISNWERGAAQPPHGAMEKVAKILNLNRKKVVDLYVDHTAQLIQKALKNSR